MDSHAFIWQNGAMTDLGTLGGSISAAAAINDKGQLAGYATIADGSERPFLWQDGKLSEVPGAFAQLDYFLFADHSDGAL